MKIHITCTINLYVQRNYVEGDGGLTLILATRDPTIYLWVLITSLID